MATAQGLQRPHNSLYNSTGPEKAIQHTSLPARRQKVLLLCEWSQWFTGFLLGLDSTSCCPYLRAGQPQLQPQLFKFTGLPQDWTVPVVGIHWPHRRAGQPQVFKFLGFPQDWNTSVVAIFAFAQGVCLSGLDSPRLFFTKLFVEF